jgi:hypothetical protein
MIILVVGHDQYADDGVAAVVVGNSIDEVFDYAHKQGWWFSDFYMDVFEIASNTVTTIGGSKKITDDPRVPEL